MPPITCRSSNPPPRRRQATSGEPSSETDGCTRKETKNLCKQYFPLRACGTVRGPCRSARYPRRRSRRSSFVHDRSRVGASAGAGPRASIGRDGAAQPFELYASESRSPRARADPPATRVGCVARDADARLVARTAVVRDSLTATRTRNGCFRDALRRGRRWSGRGAARWRIARRGAGTGRRAAARRAPEPALAIEARKQARTLRAARAGARSRQRRSRRSGSPTRHLPTGRRPHAARGAPRLAPSSDGCAGSVAGQTPKRAAARVPAPATLVSTRTPAERHRIPRRGFAGGERSDAGARRRRGRLPPPRPDGERASRRRRGDRGRPDGDPARHAGLRAGLRQGGRGRHRRRDQGRIIDLWMPSTAATRAGDAAPSRSPSTVRIMRWAPRSRRRARVALAVSPTIAFGAGVDLRRASRSARLAVPSRSAGRPRSRSTREPARCSTRTTRRCPCPGVEREAARRPGRR